MDTVIEIGAIDDEKMLLQSFANWFDSTPDIRLTATAASVDEYLAHRDAPKIVLLDLALGNFTDPAHNVAQLTKAGRQVIIMSVVKDHTWVDATAEAGAIAYVTKERDLSELADVIRAVHRGETPEPQTYAFLLNQDSLHRPALTHRERQVMSDRAEGLTLDAIGRRLGITVATVKTHVDRIRQKYLDAGRPIINPVDWRIRMEEDEIRRTLPPTDGGQPSA